MLQLVKEDSGVHRKLICEMGPMFVFFYYYNKYLVLKMDVIFNRLQR